MKDFRCYFEEFDFKDIEREGLLNCIRNDYDQFILQY